MDYLQIPEAEAQRDKGTEAQRHKDKGAKNSGCIFSVSQFGDLRVPSAAANNQ
jgi:hypothetical protein